MRCLPMWVPLAAVVMLTACALGQTQPATSASPPAFLTHVPPFDPPIINGRAWTFHTAGPAKDKRQVGAAHPRLLINRQGLPALREKLKDPAYKDYLAELVKMADRSDVCANALLYHLGIEGDKEAFGKKARELALAGTLPNWGGLEDAGLLVAVLAYDWTADLLNLEERKQVFKGLRAVVDRAPQADREHQWYENDCYARGGTPYRVLAPLAAHGDGVDDDWCRNMLAMAYDDENLLMRSPYGPRKGQGYLDVLNSIALDTGGSQAGNHGTSPTSGYTAMYLTGSPLVLAAWQTATGEQVLQQCNYLRLLPYWLAYESDRWVFNGKDGTHAYVPAGIGLAVLEYDTGLYKDVDPDMAALAAWHLKEFGTYRYALVPRLVLGDLRVKPKSPEDLKLPTAAYLRGADCFFSKSSWRPDATHIRFQIRSLDTNRYEPHTNVFSITRYGFVAPGGRVGKGTRNPGNHSGLWFYEKGGETETPTSQQGSTYWSGLRYPTKPPRASGALMVATEPWYRAGGPLAVGVHEGYRFAVADAARLLSVPGALGYLRTLVHLLPLGQDREFVVVHDRTEAEGNVRRAWNLRTLDEPAANGRADRREEGLVTYAGATEFTLVNLMGNCHGTMHMTVVLPERPSAQWRGGVNFEGVSPEGQRYVLPSGRGDYKQGYAAGDYARYKYGAGNLFIQAEPTPRRQNYLMVMQLGDAKTFDPGKSKAAVTRLGQAGSDAVQVDEWVLAFAAEPARRKSVSYALAADGAARHVVFDLEPGTYQVSKGRTVIAQTIEVTDKDFSLSFQALGARGETFTVSRRD